MHQSLLPTLHQKDYASALSAAQNGIGSASGDMRFIPGDAAQEDDNLFWMILEVLKFYGFSVKMMQNGGVIIPIALSSLENETVMPNRERSDKS